MDSILLEDLVGAIWSNCFWIWQPDHYLSLYCSVVVLRYCCEASLQTLLVGWAGLTLGAFWPQGVQWPKPIPIPQGSGGGVKRVQ